jgi:hypothetical protein
MWHIDTSTNSQVYLDSGNYNILTGTTSNDDFYEEYPWIPQNMNQICTDIIAITTLIVNAFLTITSCHHFLK